MIVLIAITEKQVVITDKFNPAPLISGRQGIFARVSAPTEMKMDVEIVGVYSILGMANAAREAHAATHPGRRYVQKVATLDDKLPEPAEPPRCIKCGTAIGPRGSFCPPCQQKHYQECLDLDPRHGEGDITPLVQTTVGPQTVLLNQGAP